MNHKSHCRASQEIFQVRSSYFVDMYIRLDYWIIQGVKYFFRNIWTLKKDFTRRILHFVHLYSTRLIEVYKEYTILSDFTGILNLDYSLSI